MPSACAATLGRDLFSEAKRIFRPSPGCPSRLARGTRQLSKAIVAVLDAQRSLLDARVAALEAQAQMADAWADLANLKKRIDKGEVTSGDLFGTREYLKNNYLYRMAAAETPEFVRV